MTTSPAIHSKWRDGLALAAGAVYPLGFAPVGIRFAVIASLCAFWWSLIGCTPGRAAFRGYLFGLGLFGVGVSWVYQSLRYFGESIAAVALLGTVGFVAVAALYLSLFSWLWARLMRFNLRHSVAVLAFSSLWTLVEWFRGWFLGGFPWLVSGYATLDTPLASLATVGGVYFNSWSLALFAGSVFLVFRAFGKESVATLFGVCLALGLIVGAVRGTAFTQPHGDPMRVRMVQGNIEQGIKFDPDNLVPSLERYLSLSQQGAENYDLLIWPETAVPAFYEQVGPVIDEFRQQLMERETDWLIGGFSYDWDTRRVFNAVRLITDEAMPEYRKFHLVPFGEYLPFRGLLDALSAIIAVPMSDISPGPSRPAPLDLGGVKIGMSICYEDAFGEELIRQLPSANLLVNVSNDAWFGDSWAPAQHQEIARLRTLETGRPQLRATNTGISAAMDYQGNIITSGPSFVEAVLDVSVQPRTGVTPYVRWGNTPVVVLLLLGVLGPLMLAHKRNLPYTAS